jgi:uncharacterized protein HemX
MPAMPRLTTPRIRMPRVTLPGRAGRGTAQTKPKTATATKATDEKPAKAPAPNLQERMEGLQGWMAEIERRQGRLTYFGAAAVLLAIVAAGAALYFGITAKNDSATKGDLDDLTTKVDSLESAVTKNTKDTQTTLNNSISQLQTSIQTLQKQQAQNAATISSLQSQASAGALGKGGATTPITPVTPTPTPGATTTTPKQP